MLSFAPCSKPLPCLPIAPVWLLLVLLLAACTPGATREGPGAEDDVLIEMTTIPSARVGSASEVLLRVTWQGGPVQGADVTLEAEALVSPARLQVAATEEFFGEYHAALTWPTAGTWQLVARATLPDGLVVEQAVGPVEVAP